MHHKTIKTQLEIRICVFYTSKQESQRCPKRRVAQAAIRLATAVIKFRNKTNEQTDLHQFRKEPSYDGDVCPCEV